MRVRVQILLYERLRWVHVLIRVFNWSGSNKYLVVDYILPSQSQWAAVLSKSRQRAGWTRARLLNHTPERHMVPNTSGR